MIIFGTRGVTMNSKPGTFHCPECNAQRSYQHKKVRRFFTLYFIPLIPLDLLGEFVECEGCKNTFKPGVLDYDPGAAREAFEGTIADVLLRCALLVAFADGALQDSERTAAKSALQKFMGRAIAEDDFDRAAALAKRDSQGVAVAVEPVATRLNGNGKEMLVRAAVQVGLADGPLQEAELAVLRKMAAALDVTPAHLNGIVSELTSPPPS